MPPIILVVITLILIYLFINWQNAGKGVYNSIVEAVGIAYEKYAPYSFKQIRSKIKELGQEYTVKQYTTQVLLYAGGAALVSYFYFYNIIVSIVYALAAVCVVPYLSYLRTKRLYSEFVFEQIQTYTTNTIMEFATTQSFVKAIDGVYESGVLEDPVKSDVKIMIDLAYKNGSIEQSIEYFNSKYDYFIVKNMHQLFLQITNEGSKDSALALENMSSDIDMLVEAVYRDRMDRQVFHKKFVQFGLILYCLVVLVEFLIGTENYITLVNTNIFVKLLLHLIIIGNTYFLLNGEKYYNENVGAE